MPSLDSEALLAHKFYEDFFNAQVIQTRRLLELQSPDQTYRAKPSHLDFVKMCAGSQVLEDLASGNDNHEKIISVIDSELRAHAAYTSMESLDYFVIMISKKLVTYPYRHLMMFRSMVFVPSFTIAELHGGNIAVNSTQPNEHVVQRLTALTSIGLAIKELEEQKETTASKLREKYEELEQLVPVLNL